MDALNVYQRAKEEEMRERERERERLCTITYNYKSKRKLHKNIKFAPICPHLLLILQEAYTILYSLYNRVCLMQVIKYTVISLKHIAIVNQNLNHLFIYRFD